MRMSDTVTVKETSDTMRGVETKESHHASATPTPAGGEEPSPTKTNGREQAETQPQAKAQTQLQPKIQPESCCQDKNETQVNLIRAGLYLTPWAQHRPVPVSLFFFFTNACNPSSPQNQPSLPTQFPYQSMACQLTGLGYVSEDYTKGICSAKW